MFFYKKSYIYKTDKSVDKVISSLNSIIYRVDFFHKIKWIVLVSSFAGCLKSVDSLMKIKLMRSLSKPLIGTISDNNTSHLICNTFPISSFRPIAKISIYEKKNKTVINVIIEPVRMAKVSMYIFFLPFGFFALKTIITILNNLIKNGFSSLNEYWFINFVAIVSILPGFILVKYLYIKEKEKILSNIKTLL